MPYAAKDETGRIVSLHREPGSEGREFLPADHPQVLAFLGTGAGNAATAQFHDLDLEVIRVIEDVVDTLIGKNLLAITDLPPAAREKLLKRRRLREEVGSGILVDNIKLF
ncbi:MAG: hypothetical protein WBP72_04855 [Rhodocyclaceae bacterium]